MCTVVATTAVLRLAIVASVFISLSSLFPRSDAAPATKANLCWRKHKGECFHKDENCPFRGGREIDSTTDKETGEHLCNGHNEQVCCIPKKIKNGIDRGECGKSKSSKNSFRIFHGSVADHGQWPWMVLLVDDRGEFCGGTLIHPEWVLTAAHCFNRTQNFTLYFGEHSRSQDDGTEQSVPLKRIIIHEHYQKPEDPANDIALVELAEPVNITDYVDVICLPQHNDTFDNRLCTVIGFGKTEKSNKGSDVLLELNLPMVRNSKCGDYHCSNVQSTSRRPVFEENICAGYRQGNRDSCTGDSGGPIMCSSFEHQWILAGVTSWGSKLCGDKAAPGVYTKVTAYLDWIVYVTQLPFFDDPHKNELAMETYSHKPVTLSASCDKNKK